MFINDVNKKEEIRTIATQQLRLYGIKYRPKKQRNVQVPSNSGKYPKKFFKVPLQNLDAQTVTLKDGRQLIVPKLVHEMCSFILTKVTTEGIFRKEGSKSRQNEIKMSLDRGCLLGDEHHEIDVAVVLKSFLRDLPEPLIPSAFQELFLQCSIVANKVPAILLSCLLLPTEHLNVLSYLMQFFSEVASFHDSNKMNVTNFSIILGPNVFPIDEKIVPKNQHVLTKTCDIVKILLDNSKNIGVIPEYIILKVGKSEENKADLIDKQRKKKRRSGSLTRMFNGLKKIVGSKTEDTSPSVVTPDILHTPLISRSTKKRRQDLNGLSAKKKKEIIECLPEANLLSTPFTPHRTPVSVNPNPRLTKQQLDKVEEDNTKHKEKKNQWNIRSHSVKNLKDKEETLNKRLSLGPKTMLERRWSAVSQAANFRKKKKTTQKVEAKSTCDISAKECAEPEYVKVSKEEYEEIKSRVSAIEKTISMEFVNVQSQVSSDKENISEENNIVNVQNAYEQTLGQAEPLSPATDQLARRLSKGLRIRHSAEQKVIRSPSARKIGSIRRRSRELEKQTTKLARNQSWHVPSSNRTDTLIPGASLRRFTKPTILQPSQINSETPTINTPTRRITRSSSHLESSQQMSASGSSSSQWTSAEGFFKTMKTPASLDYSNGRASLAKLRSQNAGMVLAKAKLFDNLQDFEHSTETNSSQEPNKTCHRVKTSNKIGALRNTDARMSYRIRSLKSENRRIAKKSMSPRRRNAVQLSQKQRLQAAKQYIDTKGNSKNCSLESIKTPSKMEIDYEESPRRTPQTPHIKKPILVKSPKRLCRTPQNLDRQTPLKVLATTVYKL